MNNKIKILIPLVISAVMLCGCGNSKDNDKKEKVNGNNVEVTENSDATEDSDKTNDTSDENSDTEVLTYDWSGSYYLKNGTGDLTITQKNNKTFDFTITGANEGDEKKIDSTTGTAQIDEDTALYELEDGRSISFFIVGQTSIEVRLFAKDGTEEFVGAYLPQ